MNAKKLLTLCLLFILFPFGINAQNMSNDSIPFNKKRLHYVIGSGTTFYTVGMTGLYFLWYKDYDLGAFHFLNDNNEWLAYDKFGHATSTYQISHVGYESLKWTGWDENKCIWYGGMFGLLFQTTFEIFDGISEAWGASPGDLIANTAGTALFIGQQSLWHEQRIQLKLSAHLGPYAQYRPKILGSNIPERLIKDYNAQTIWLSCNIDSFLPKNNSFPDYINIALGYSIEGLTGGVSNPSMVDGQPIPSFERRRQYYLSLDIDLSKIPIRNPHLRSLINIIDFIKIPFPALYYDESTGFGFDPFYF